MFKRLRTEVASFIIGLRYQKDHHRSDNVFMKLAAGESPASVDSFAVDAPSSAKPDSEATRGKRLAPFGTGPGGRPWGDKKKTYLLPIKEDW
jgi:hypothetical protein